MAAVAAAEDETNPLPDEPSSDEPVPGMAEWKDTYEGYLKEWHAESAIAREKALSTRLAIEKQREEEKRAAEDKVKGEKKAKSDEVKKARDAQKLKEELEGKSNTAAHSAREKEDRERRVKEAWEMVKSAPEGGEVHEVATDGRGVTPQDLAAGQAIASGHTREPVKQVSLTLDLDRYVV